MALHRLVHIWSAFLLIITSSTPVRTHENGMDMSMDGAMSLAEGQMLPYLHFTAGDNLWFLGWVPKSAGAMIGTCIGLFLLALVDRWIAECRAMMEVHWSRR
jgi:solute carrier family 31 (copper transporter), member 1